MLWSVVNHTLPYNGSMSETKGLMYYLIDGLGLYTYVAILMFTLIIVYSVMTWTVYVKYASMFTSE